MKRLLGIAAMLTAVTLAALYALRGRHVQAIPPSAPSDRPVSVRTIDVPNQTQGLTIRLSGAAKGAHDVAVSPKVPARIRALFVRNGSVVTCGSRLAQLDMGDLEAQLDAARAGVAAARAVFGKAVRGKAARAAELDAALIEAEGRLRAAELKLREAELGTPLATAAAAADADRSSAGVRQAEAGVHQAEIGCEEAEDAVKRLELLHRHGGVSDVELSGARSKASMARAALDMARAALDLARASERPAVEAAPVRERLGKAQLEAARAGVELAKEGVRIAQRARKQALEIADRDGEAAKAQLSQAEAGLRQARTAIGSDVLTSPVDGVVTKLTGQVGEYAQPGFAIMRVVSPTVNRIEAAAPIRLASQIRVGMGATIIHADRSLPRVAGRVSSIGTVAEPGGRTVPVTVAPLRPLTSVRPGAQVTVELTGSGVRRILLPSDAVKQDAFGLHVFLISDGRAMRKAVAASVQRDGSWWVRSGISGGDRVICPIPDGIANGTRVHEAAP